MKLLPISKLTLASLVLFCLPIIALAAPYVPLEPLPFLSQVRGTRLPDLLQALFQLLIIGGAGVAVLMITIGGIQYMTGEALHQKSEGRARIQNSVLGLILLLFIYLLLRTINPQLLNFNLSSIERVGGASDRVVQQARATEAQRNAAAATVGPSTTNSVCPAGDVFCAGGSALGFNNGAGSADAQPNTGTTVNVTPNSSGGGAFQVTYEIEGVAGSSWTRVFSSYSACSLNTTIVNEDNARPGAQRVRVVSSCQETGAQTNF